MINAKINDLSYFRTRCGKRMNVRRYLELNQSESGKKEYQDLVKELSPNSKLVMNCVKAFLVGGFICTIGEVITEWLAYMGYPKEERGLYTAMILIFVASLLTGLGIYDKFGKFSGAGTIVPITGFSNSISAPALEFKKEGLILGVGAKIFVVAGPVIMYGTIASVVVGIIYYFLS